MGRELKSAGKYQRWVLFCGALLLALGSLHCGERELGAVRVDSADAGGTPRSILDASLPQADADFDSQDDITEAPDADATPVAYVLPENSITTCAEFLSCMNDCPPEVGSCVGPCHDAMTERAAADVRSFFSCAAQNHCRDQDCLMGNCGQILSVCMR